MTKELQQQVNQLLTEAGRNTEIAVSQACEAASALILKKQFIYAHTIINLAQALDVNRGQCWFHQIPDPNAKSAKTTNTPEPT